MDETIYNEGDTIHVAIWKQLIYYGCNQAAVGLLCDVFVMFEVAERVRAEGHEPPPFAKDGLSASANLRSDLMTMLGDVDSDANLRAWTELYHSDHNAFLQYAEDWVEEAGHRLHAKEPPEFDNPASTTPG